MIIEYYIKSVYGNDLMYIKDEEQAKAVQMLTGKRTIDNRDMYALAVLGIQCMEVHK